MVYNTRFRQALRWARASWDDSLASVHAAQARAPLLFDRVLDFRGILLRGETERYYIWLRQLDNLFWISIEIK